MLIEGAVALTGGALTWLYLNGKDQRKMRSLWRETLLNCKSEGVKLTTKSGTVDIVKTFMLNKLYPRPYGWLGICNIPTGLTFSALEKSKESLEDAFGCCIEMKKDVDKKHRTFGKIKFIFNVYNKEFEPIKPPKFGMLPLGYSKDGKPCFLNLMQNPHILISGETGSGKTVLMCTMMTNLIYYWNDLIDLYLSQIEKNDSYYFSDCKTVRRTSCTLEETLVTLKKAEEWMEERTKIFKELQIIDIAQYNRSYITNPYKSIYYIS
jgi:S-DNA-T family DNA segregation ATPase FtsK/SpoIIIE